MKISVFSLLLFIFCVGNLNAQKTIVYGKVIDGETNEPIPFAGLTFVGTKTSVLTDIDGKYSFNTYYVSDSLKVFFTGYKSVTKFVKVDKSQEINFTLYPQSNQLKEFVVKPGKKEENPAHALLRKVIRNKKINNRAKLDAYQYETYNKVEFDLNNVSKVENMKLLKKVDFIFDNIDSTTSEKSFLPFFISESISDFYYQRKPKKQKEIIKASQVSGVENESFLKVTGDIYININVYDNIMVMFNKNFISPVNSNALFYYHYFLTDSSIIDNKKCFKLEFFPKRKNDLAFEGHLWIHDTTFAIKEVKAKIGETANINFIKSHEFIQKFDQVADEAWMMLSDESVSDVNIGEKQSGFYVRKHTHYKDFVINQPKEPEFFERAKEVILNDSANKRNAEYWDKNRHVKLDENEAKIYQMIDTLRTIPVIRNTVKTIKVLATGYWIKGPVEIGNIYNFVSGNPIEGRRLSIGGRTSNDFSKWIELSAYFAYGFKDEETKYGVGTRFFVTKKKRRMFFIDYKKDIARIDLGFNGTNSENLFSSIARRNRNNKLMGVEGFRIKYFNEWYNGLSNYIELTSNKYSEVSSRIPFNEITGTDTVSVGSFDNSEIALNMRIAPNEKYLSGEFDRVSLGTSKPIFNITLGLGIKGLLGSDYSYQKVVVGMTHSLRLGFLGKAKYGFEVGKIWGDVPFPLLFIHRGNDTWGYNDEAYNMMNVGEFMSSEYISAYIEHHFDGLFLNRIPLFKKLKWREVVGGKIIYGRNTVKNNQFELPFFSSSLEGEPYAEMSVGIENIFKVFRIDGLWRINYLENEFTGITVSQFALRFKFQISF